MFWIGLAVGTAVGAWAGPKIKRAVWHFADMALEHRAHDWSKSSED
jgi:hypothetical protein